MPLGTLGACSSDLLGAEGSIRNYTKEYCAIINNRFQPAGLPPYIQPPKNAVRWEPGKRSPLTFVAPATGVDILVFEDRMDLGYDGLLISLPNVWAGTGFVEGSGVITWRWKLDRRFIPYYDTVLTSQSLAVPLDVVGQGIPVYSGQLLQCYANFSVGAEASINNGGMTIAMGRGYKWPRERPAGL